MVVHIHCIQINEQLHISIFSYLLRFVRASMGKTGASCYICQLKSLFEKKIITSVNVYIKCIVRINKVYDIFLFTWLRVHPQGRPGLVVTIIR